MPLCETDLITVLITLMPHTPGMTLLNHEHHAPSLARSAHSLQTGLCHWAEELTQCSIGHMEQLYTFSDHSTNKVEPEKVHISYIALTDTLPKTPHTPICLYHFFPWEDRRTYTGNTQLNALRSAIQEWAHNNQERFTRINSAFGLNGLPWDDSRVLERYELLWESNLVSRYPQHHTNTPYLPDNRRLLATALSRLRARIRYTPAVFELLPPHFTLLNLQQAMETLSGRYIHKPNFRRLVLHQNLLEETGKRDASSPGRPAKLYRFRPSATTSCYLSSAFLPLN